MRERKKQKCSKINMESESDIVILENGIKNTLARKEKDKVIEKLS